MLRSTCRFFWLCSVCLSISIPLFSSQQEGWHVCNTPISIVTLWLPTWFTERGERVQCLCSPGSFLASLSQVGPVPPLKATALASLSSLCNYSPSVSIYSIPAVPGVVMVPCCSQPWNNAPTFVYYSNVYTFY